MASTKAELLTRSRAPLTTVLISTTALHRVSDECSPIRSQAKRVEYNLFRPAAVDDHVPLIALEEADRDWLCSMEAEGWPELPPDYFKRHFVDSGDDADGPTVRPETPLRYSGIAATPESTELVRAAA
jgi:hypothetical protein